MYSFTNQEPTVAEQRPPVLIPAPFAGAGKKLQSDFAMLRARADALETDRGHAALHRADFARELEAMAEDRTEMIAAKKGKSKTRREAIAEVTGVVDLVEDKAVGFEAMQVRDIAIGLLRKELALRSDLDGYLERRLSEGQKSVVTLREKLEETRADILKRLVELGYDDPATNKLSASRVMPGFVNDHPAVRKAVEELRAVEGSVNESKLIAANAREIEELRRLVRSEVARISGLAVA